MKLCSNPNFISWVGGNAGLWEEWPGRVLRVCKPSLRCYFASWMKLQQKESPRYTWTWKCPYFNLLFFLTSALLFQKLWQHIGRQPTSLPCIHASDDQMTSGFYLHSSSLSSLILTVFCGTATDFFGTALDKKKPIHINFMHTLLQNTNVCW